MRTCNSADNFYTSSGSSPPLLAHYHPPTYTPPSDDEVARQLPLIRLDKVLGSQAPPEKPSIFTEVVAPCPTPRLSNNVDYDTGEILPRMVRNYRGEWVEDPCTTNGCPSCSVTNARRLSGAILLAWPSHKFYVTLLGSDYQEINNNMGNLMTHMRRSDDSLQWVWAAEPNPRSTGNHAHGFIHCSSGEVDPEVLAAACRRYGIGQHCDLEPVPSSYRASNFGYLFKSLVVEEDREVFLDLNGSPDRRKIAHWSGEFWRDGVDGRRLTKDEALKVSLRKYLQGRQVSVASA
jgi:hypothetical protein